LLRKFFHGQCTEHEAGIVREWLQDPKNEATAKAMMRRQWETIADGDADVDIESLLMQTKRALRADDTPVPVRRGKSRWFETVSFRVAASVALVVASAAAVIMRLEGDAVQEIAGISKVEEVRTSTGQIILKV